MTILIISILNCACINLCLACSHNFGKICGFTYHAPRKKMIIFYNSLSLFSSSAPTLPTSTPLLLPPPSTFPLSSSDGLGHDTLATLGLHKAQLVHHQFNTQQQLLTSDPPSSQSLPSSFSPHSLIKHEPSA